VYNGRGAAVPSGKRDTLSELGISDLPGSLSGAWDESARACPAPEDSPFTTGSIREAGGRVGLLPATTEACLGDAAVIRNTPSLFAFAWHSWRTIFESGTDVRPDIAAWPLPGILQGRDFPRLPPFFWAVVLLGGAGRVFHRNSAKGVPEGITAETLRDLDLWIHECRLRTGQPGFLELCWLVYHFSGRLFALGRLHFDMRGNDVGFHLLGCGKPVGAEGLLALAADGMRFRADGQFVDADRAMAPLAWTAAFSEQEGAFRGFPATPTGAVSPEPTLREPPAWSRIASPDSAVLGIHIPAAGPFHGPLTPEACSESLARAVPFFREHFPEHEFEALTCRSWILDSQLSRCLPESSNIVRFQRRFVLVPVEAANDGQTIERVYGVPAAQTGSWDWAAAPDDTGLRRILVSHVRTGGRWRMGGGIMPAWPAGGRR
jgi:hypothetical protein